MFAAGFLLYVTIDLFACVALYKMMFAYGVVFAFLPYKMM